MDPNRLAVVLVIALTVMCGVSAWSIQAVLKTLRDSQKFLLETLIVASVNNIARADAYAGRVAIGGLASALGAERNTTTPEIIARLRRSQQEAEAAARHTRNKNHRPSFFVESGLTPFTDEEESETDETNANKENANA